MTERLRITPEERQQYRKIVTRFYNAMKRDDLKAFLEFLKEYPKMLHWDRGDAFTPLHCAADFGSVRIADYLISEGIFDVNVKRQEQDPRRFDVTPLMVSATRNPNMIRFLHERGGNLDAAARLHGTPLRTRLLFTAS